MGANVLIDTVRTTESLVDRVRRIETELRQVGIAPVDMRKAGTLETDVSLPLMGDDFSLDVPTIELIEGGIRHIPIGKRNHSQFRWFVDGSQKTLLVWRIGVVPIVVSISVSAVLERADDGTCLLVPTTMAESVVWLIPEQIASPEIRRTVEVLRQLGQLVKDPLESQPNYQQLAGMYDQLLFYANKMSGTLRAETELATLELWREYSSLQSTDDWLLIDGRLRVDMPNAVGLIKEPGRQHLAGEDAVTLFNLPAGHRTSAYRLTEAGRTRTHWYQRMWPDTSLDARHALIRIEASGDTADSQEIDNIASWLIAERVPRPTADSRWATLLYPVHLLERMLKQRINRITAGWPV